MIYTQLLNPLYPFHYIHPTISKNRESVFIPSYLNVFIPFDHIYFILFVKTNDIKFNTDVCLPLLASSLHPHELYFFYYIVKKKHIKIYARICGKKFSLKLNVSLKPRV
eukprot:163470_1